LKCHDSEVGGLYAAGPGVFVSQGECRKKSQSNKGEAKVDALLGVVGAGWFRVNRKGAERQRTQRLVGVGLDVGLKMLEVVALVAEEASKRSGGAVCFDDTMRLL
jgi:hypothetical protein